MEHNVLQNGLVKEMRTLFAHKHKQCTMTVRVSVECVSRWKPSEWHIKSTCNE